MSTVHLTAHPAAATTPRARTTTESLPATELPAGATQLGRPHPRRPLRSAVRTVGIMVDTVARVVFLGRDGVNL